MNKKFQCRYLNVEPQMNLPMLYQLNFLDNAVKHTSQANIFIMVYVFFLFFKQLKTMYRRQRELQYIFLYSDWWKYDAYLNYSNCVKNWLALDFTPRFSLSCQRAIHWIILDKYSVYDGPDNLSIMICFLLSEKA